MSALAKGYRRNDPTLGILLAGRASIHIVDRPDQLISHWILATDSYRFTPFPTGCLLPQVMTTPRLSICIPTFNREGLLRETLTHLREVCDEDIEIAISDNCSSDGTQDVIDSFAGQFQHFRAIRQTGKIVVQSVAS